MSDKKDNVIRLFPGRGSRPGPNHVKGGTERTAPGGTPPIDFRSLIENAAFQLNQRFIDNPELYISVIDKDLAIATDYLNDAQMNCIGSHILGDPAVSRQSEINRAHFLGEVTKLASVYLQLKHWYWKKHGKEYTSQYSN